MLKRFAPLQRNKPLARTKTIAKLRRRASRANHKSADEKRHMDRVAAMGCIVSGKTATLHHVSATIHGGRIARSHKRVVPLAPEYHLIQHGSKSSVEALGHGGFFTKYGIDLLAEADRLWSESEALNG